MNETTATIETPEGPMDAFLAIPDGTGRRPALLVFQEAFGVNDHIRDVTRRFAREGYVALAPELYHRSGRGIEVAYGDFPGAMPHLARVKNDGLAGDVRAALRYLRAHERVAPARVAAIGYCLGGYVAFLAACRTDVKGSVSYYGGGIVRSRPGFGYGGALEEAGAVATPLLFFFGEEDPSIPPEDVDAIRARLSTLGKAHEIVVYPNAGHAFFSDPRPSYRPEAARDAWRRTLEWLGRTLGAAGAGAAGAAGAGAPGAAGDAGADGTAHG